MRKKAKEIFNDYFINGWGIKPNDSFEVEYVDAKQFLRAERIDLICKLIYLDCKIKNYNLDFAKELYLEHIRAFSQGSFTEPGTEEKNTIQKYFESFDELIEDCKKNGITSEKSAVGVGENGSIMDGSHRTAIAIYFGLPLPIVKIPNRSVVYDYEFFQNRGLNRKYLDFMVYEFVKRTENCFIANLWPIADNKDKRKEVENLLFEYSSVVYKKELKLNYDGLRHFMIHTYGLGREADKWAGDESNRFKGIDNKAADCYKSGGVTSVYVLSNTSIDKIIALKKRVREIFDIGNHSIHITDTKEEAIFLSQVAFNNNSIDLLNNSEPFKYPHFCEKLNVFREAIMRYGGCFEDYIIDSSSVLALYGLRDARDIDYISLKTKALPNSDVFEYHDRYYASLSPSEIYNPDNYMFFRGLKFVSINKVESLKKYRCLERKKDVSDLNLIRKLNYLRVKKSPMRWRRETLVEYIKKGDNKITRIIVKIYSFMKKSRH